MNIVKKLDIGFILYFGSIFYVIFFGTRFFGTNDDMLMMLFVSGIYTGEPSEYIIFQNIVVGQFLKQLYILNATINWYIVFLSTVQVLAFTALYFQFRRLLDKSTLFFLIVLPMLYFIVEFNLYLQFTKVAFLSEIVGMLYFLTYFYKNKDKYLVLSFVFILLGFVVRHNTMYGVLLVALPILMMVFIRHRGNILNKKFFGFIFLLVSILFSLKIYNYQYYSNSTDWQKPYERILTRGGFYHDRSITKECFKKNGLEYNISTNDIETFYKWTNDDQSVYTTKMFNHISKSCSKPFLYKYKRVQNLNFLNLFFEKLSSFQFIFLYLFCIYLLFVIHRKYRVFILFYFIYVIAILFYLSTVALDNRVVASLTLEFYLILLLFSCIIGTKKYYIHNKLVAFSAIGLFLAYIYISIFEQVVYKKTPFPIERELEILKDNYVVVAKSGNFFSYLPIDTDFVEMFKDVKFYYSGWNISTPYNDKVLGSMSNFYELLLQKPNVILYTDAHRIPIIKQYIYEHYHKYIGFYNLHDDYYKINIVEN